MEQKTIIITEQKKNKNDLATCNTNTTFDHNVVEASISLAYSRLNSKQSTKAIDTVKFLIDIFPDLSEFDFIQALKNGASGLYGESYKLSDQIICVWIRKYLESKSKIKKDSMVYYRWVHDPSGIKLREIEKDKAKEFFESQEKGGYIAEIIK